MHKLLMQFFGLDSSTVEVSKAEVFVVGTAHNDAISHGKHKTLSEEVKVSRILNGNNSNFRVSWGPMAMATWA